jgi:hypothetical protein
MNTNAVGDVSEARREKGDKTLARQGDVACSREHRLDTAAALRDAATDGFGPQKA